MVHTIIVPNDIIFRALISLIEGKVVPLKNLAYEVYSNGAIRLIGAYGDTNISQVLNSVLAEFAPETTFFLGESYPVSDERLSGDIVLPNVFFRSNPELKNTEIDRENRDSLLSEPLFIEHYTLQGDYNFDTFGLSVGGIHVSGDWDSSDENFRTNLRLAYENDTFDSEIYDFVQKAQNLGILEKVYPVAYIWTEDPLSQARSLLSIVRFFIGSITGEVFEEEEEIAPSKRESSWDEEEDTDAWAKSEEDDE